MIAVFTTSSRVDFSMVGNDHLPAISAMTMVGLDLMAAFDFKAAFGSALLLDHPFTEPLRLDWLRLQSVH